MLILPQLTILPELRDKFVSGGIEQSGHIVIQGVHVLHQPLIGLVVHLRNDDLHTFGTSSQELDK